MTAFVGGKGAGLLAVAILMFGTAVAGAESNNKDAEIGRAERTLRVATLSSVSPVEAEVVPPSSKRFARLPPSGRMIAHALFNAQKFALGERPGEIWTLDRIAAERQSGLGWGQVFRAMKAEGRIVARNLNEAISTARHLGPDGPHRIRYADVSVSLGYGHRVFVGQAEAVGKGARPSAATGTNRIELGRIVVSDFDRSDGAERRRFIRPFGAVRIYRD